MKEIKCCYCGEKFYIFADIEVKGLCKECKEYLGLATNVLAKDKDSVIK